MVQVHYNVTEYFCEHSRLNLLLCWQYMVTQWGSTMSGSALALVAKLEM